jgi:hypothetical protein
MERRCCAACEQRSDRARSLAGSCIAARLLASVNGGDARSVGRSLHRQRTAGDRLDAMIGISQANEQTPSVEGRSDTASERPATLQVVRREAAPNPTGSSTHRRQLPTPRLDQEFTGAQN